MSKSDFELVMAVILTLNNGFVIFNFSFTIKNLCKILSVD